MNTIITFENAKLLKENGFDLLIKERWCIVENIDGDKSPFCQKECGLFNWNSDKYPEYISAPTIVEVVMWLYEKHGIWTVVNISIDNTWYFEFFNLKDKRNAEIEVRYEIAGRHNSPTEAYQEAIKYTLENLI